MQLLTVHACRTCSPAAFTLSHHGLFFPARVRMPDMYGAQLVSLDMAAEVLGVLQAHAQWLAEAKYWLHRHALCS